MAARNHTATNRAAWHMCGAVPFAFIVMLAPALAIAPKGDDVAKQLSQGLPGENSVLVARVNKSATRVASNTSTTDSSLEPISDYAEVEPELATEEPAVDLTIVAAGDEKAPADDEPAADEQEAVTDEAEAKPTTSTPAPNSPAPKTPAVSEPQPIDVPAAPLFHGIQPGTTTKQELIAEWGQPQSTKPAPAGELHSFQMAPFRQVDVLVEEGIVALVRVEFAKGEDANTLARKIHADKIQRVELTDNESGHPMGYAYPEQGIIFVLQTSDDDVTPLDQPLVGTMMLQTPDAQAFALRAEQRPAAQVTRTIADLEQSLAIDDTNAHAYWLLAGARLSVGQADKAYTAALRATQLDSASEAYKLRLAQSLIELGQYDRAVLLVRELLDDQELPQVTRAEAFHVMGTLASLGDATIAEKSIGFHNTAIGIADTLATSQDNMERRVAKRLLVDAHLAIAREVSRRDFAGKADSVGQWLGRASGFAEEFIANDQGGLELRLKVAVDTMATLVNLKNDRSPQSLLDEVRETGDTILREETDPLWQQQINWQMGLAYLHALQIEHLRREPATAIEYGEQAIKLLASGAESRLSSPETERIVGRLYFHLGAVYAVHKNDHLKASRWYDKAEPLLTSAQPASELYVSRRDGEALVSMAVSYWDQDDYQHAVTLTETGAKLVEKAATAGVVERATLAVPYSNLSVMHKQLGNTAEASRYAKLADSAKRTPLAQPNEQPATAATKQAPPSNAARSQPTATQRPDRTAQRPTTQQPSSPSRKSTSGKPAARGTMLR